MPKVALGYSYYSMYRTIKEKEPIKENLQLMINGVNCCLSLATLGVAITPAKETHSDFWQLEGNMVRAKDFRQGKFLK